jgi:hypothetical protein
MTGITGMNRYAFGLNPIKLWSLRLGVWLLALGLNYSTCTQCKALLDSVRRTWTLRVLWDSSTGVPVSFQASLYTLRKAPPNLVLIHSIVIMTPLCANSRYQSVSFDTFRSICHPSDSICQSQCYLISKYSLDIKAITLHSLAWFFRLCYWFSYIWYLWCAFRSIDIFWPEIKLSLMLTILCF